MTQNIPTAVDDIERALAEARELKRWWADAESGKASPDWFELVAAYPGAQATRGFYANVRVMGRDVPLMGHTGDYFFDWPAKDAPLAWITEQVRAFALKHWLGAQNWSVMLPYQRLDRLEPHSGLMGLNSIPRTAPRKSGLASKLRAYRLRSSGQTVEVAPSEADNPVDLTTLAETYRWVLMERNFLEFDLALAIGGNTSLTLSVPAGLAGAMAISPDLVISETRGAQGVAGEFGIAAGWTGVPEGMLRGVQGTVHPAMTQHTLRVLDTGEIRLRATTMLARSSLVSSGLVDRLLKAVPGSEPMQNLEKKILLADATAMRDGLLGTRITWLGTADWCAPASAAS